MTTTSRKRQKRNRTKSSKQQQEVKDKQFELGKRIKQTTSAPKRLVNNNSDFASCSEPELEISTFCSNQGKQELRRKARYLEARMRMTTTKLKLTQGKVRTRRENNENEIEALN